MEIKNNIRPFEPSPERLSKLVAGWRPFANLALKKETADLLELSPGEQEKLTESVASYIDAISNELASNCEVAQDKDGVYFVYFPAGVRQWESLQNSFERNLGKAVGAEKAAYILQSSKIDFDLLTGNNGAYSRLARIETVPPRDDGIPTPPFYVRLMQGPSMLSQQNEFSPAIQNRIRQDAKTVTPWSAQYYFEQPPAFLSKIVGFADAK